MIFLAVLLPAVLSAQRPLLGIPDGHTNVVRSLYFSQDGKLLLSGSFDGSLKLWDLASGKLLVSSPSTDQWILAGTVLSPDNRYASFSWSMTEAIPRIWDIEKNETYNTWGPLIQGFSADGTLGMSYEGVWSVEQQSWEEHEEVIPLSFPAQAITPDGTRFYQIQSGGIRFWDVSTRQLVEEVDIAGLPENARLLSNGELLEASDYDIETGQDTYTFWSLATREQIAAYQPEPGQQLRDATSDGAFGVFVSEYGMVQLVDLKSAQVVKKMSNTVRGSGYGLPVPGDAKFSRDGSYFAVGSSDGEIRMYSTSTGEHIRTLRSHISPIVEMTNRAHIAGLRTVDNCQVDRAWNFRSGQIDEAPKEKPALPFAMQAGYRIPRNILTPDGSQEVVFGFNDDGILIDRSTRQPVQTLASVTDQGKKPSFGTIASDGNTLLAWNSFELTDGASDLFVYDLTTGVVQLHFQEANQGWTTCAAFDPSGRFIATGTWGNQVNLFDRSTGQYVKTFKGHKTALESLTFSEDGKYLYSSGNDGQIMIWDMASQTVLAMLTHVDMGDWIVLGPNGLFDASGPAMELMYYTLYDQGKWEVIELEQLKARYYEPGLLPKLLGLSDRPLRSVQGFAEVPLYPEVEISIEQDELSVRLTPRNGGIGPISLFINGKEATNNANPTNASSFTYDLRPLQKFMYRHPDSTNTISLRAYNEEGWLKSPDISRAYVPTVWTRGTGTGSTDPTETPNPTLYVVAIGTSDYASTQMKLQYADQDAKVMALALHAVGAQLFPASDKLAVACLNTDPAAQDTLASENISWAYASKDNIAGVFSGLRQKARPEDIVLVYFSGHGVTYGPAEQAQFYYLTHGVVSEDLSDDAVRQQFAISTGELTGWLNNIPALKQVLVIDACNSGKVVESLTAGTKNINSSQIRALDRMKDRTGMFILSGSAADKVSYEASAYGQGLLTYALLQGMMGVATRKTADGDYVDVMQLFQHARDEVPRLAGTIKGIQTPMLGTPRRASSFDIGLFNQNVRIPLIQKKTVLTRSSFQDDNFGDALGLEAELEKLLRLESEKGQNATLIYVDVDVREYPDAYAVRGRYRQENGQIFMEAKLFANNAEPITLEIPARENAQDMSKMIFRAMRKALRTRGQ